MVNAGIDVLSEMKPASEGGASTFFAVVLQVFSLCFKYQAQLSVSQFFDTSAKAQNESVVAMKSQIVIDILTYGLTY